MFSADCNAGCQSLAPFFDRVVNHFLAQTVPFLLNTTSVILRCLYTRSCMIPTPRSRRGSDPDCLAARERSKWRKNMRWGRDCFWNMNILDFQISQGSVAIQLKWGGSLYNRSIEIFLTVKGMWKSVFICRSYDQKQSGCFFWIKVYILAALTFWIVLIIILLAETQVLN